MEPFVELLRQLRRGIPVEFWPDMLVDIRVYAQVDSDAYVVVLRPKWPVMFEGAVFDLDHPIVLWKDDWGNLRIINETEEQDAALLRDVS
jgi:hypothetical protein